jgi:hypothetical protein
VNLSRRELLAEFVVDTLQVGVVLLKVDSPTAGTVALCGKSGDGAAVLSDFEREVVDAGLQFVVVVDQAVDGQGGGVPLGQGEGDFGSWCASEQVEDHLRVSDLVCV